jgi:hypothetical protein
MCYVKNQSSPINAEIKNNQNSVYLNKMTMCLVFFSFVLTILFDLVSCALIIQPTEETEDCTKGGKAKYIDFSKLLAEPYNDTLFYLNGKK